MPAHCHSRRGVYRKACRPFTVRKLFLDALYQICCQLQGSGVYGCNSDLLHDEPYCK